MDSPYLTVCDVAELLGKSLKWVYENKGVIPGFFKLSGSIFFDREVLLSGLKKAATQSVKRQALGRISDRHGLLS